MESDSSVGDECNANVSSSPNMVNFTSETLRLDIVEEDQVPPIDPALEASIIAGALQKKKTPSFQITSVVFNPENDNDDSADEGEDVSEIIDTSRNISDFEQETPSVSEEGSKADEGNKTSEEISKSQHNSVSVTSNKSITALVNQNESGNLFTQRLPQGYTVNMTNGGYAITDPEAVDGAVHPYTENYSNNRFKIVKIASNKPFKKGRWICFDVVDNTNSSSANKKVSDSTPSVSSSKINTQNTSNAPSPNAQIPTQVSQVSTVIPASQYTSTGDVSNANYNSPLPSGFSLPSNNQQISQMNMAQPKQALPPQNQMQSHVGTAVSQAIENQNQNKSQNLIPVNINNPLPQVESTNTSSKLVDDQPPLQHLDQSCLNKGHIPVNPSYSISNQQQVLSSQSIPVQQVSPQAPAQIQPQIPSCLGSSVQHISDQQQSIEQSSQPSSMVSSTHIHQASSNQSLPPNNQAANDTSNPIVNNGENIGQYTHQISNASAELQMYSEIQNSTTASSSVVQYPPQQSPHSSSGISTHPAAVGPQGQVDQSQISSTSSASVKSSTSDSAKNNQSPRNSILSNFGNLVSSQFVPTSASLTSENVQNEECGSEGEKTSASTMNNVNIDNKIEQAMDLVKSHLMFAVREEVDVLKEHIGELMERINHLEYENTVLRKYAPEEALQQLQNPNQNQ